MSPHAGSNKRLQDLPEVLPGESLVLCIAANCVSYALYDADLIADSARGSYHSYARVSDGKIRGDGRMDARSIIEARIFLFAFDTGLRHSSSLDTPVLHILSDTVERAHSLLCSDI